MNDLKQIALEIREIIRNYQVNNQLTFIEDTHTYYIMGPDGKITSDMPSVSTVLKSFYHVFDSRKTKSFQNCEGDTQKEKELLTEWSLKGDYATNMGSRVHFLLEKELVSQYGSYKDVRLPIFNCDNEQIAKGDAMIKAGKDFIDLMHERGAILLDTEMVLGNVDLGYFGQPDKVWLIISKTGEIGFIITDWKTNQKKNFEVQPWTKIMLPPFEYIWDTSLGHYYVQIPLYAKLLLKMLEGTKYDGIKFLGGIVVLLRDDEIYEEYRIPQDIIKTVMHMDVKSILEERKDLIKQHKFLEKRDSDFIN